MGSTVYVGFAITSHSAVAYSTAYFTYASIGAVGDPPDGPPPAGPGNQSPSVTLTSPASGASFAAPATITLNATATDPDGGVAVVEFYSGSYLLGSDSSSPYSLTVYGVPANTYSFTAVARDLDGAMTVSSERVVSVGGSGPKFAVFVPSANQATSVNHYTFDVYPVGTDPYASNPIASLNLGLPPVVNGESRVDITTFVAGLPPGNYVATVIAIGSGGSAESEPSPQFSR